MIKKIKNIEQGGRLFWLDRSSPRGTSSLFKIAALSLLLVFQFPSLDWAQGNLVNLYNWHDATADIPPSDSNLYAFAVSPNFAEFDGGLTSNSVNGGPPWIQPRLTGILDTTPGATYEISYTLSTGETAASVDMLFGDSDALYEYCGGDMGFSTNLVYTFEAASTTTQMSFECNLDPVQSIDLFGVSVVEVPEIRSGYLIVFLGCAWWFAKKWRRLMPSRVGVAANR